MMYIKGKIIHEIPIKNVRSTLITEIHDQSKSVYIDFTLETRTVTCDITAKGFPDLNKAPDVRHAVMMKKIKKKSL